MAKKFMIRADDLGYSRGVNYGILDSLQGELVKTVGVMTNMEASEHGVELLKGMDLCLGQHTSISAGRPITDPSKIPSITTSDGFLKSSSDYRSAKEDFVVLDEVILEIEAQYQRFVALTGQQPVYFEGHAVASDNFFKGLEIVAKKHSLKYLGMSLDGTPVTFNDTPVYLHMESMLPNYDPAEAILRAAKAHGNACDIYVCHPGYLDADILEHSTLTTDRVHEVQALRDAELRERLEELGVELVTFSDLLH
ncbi:MAG: ChbG/HpnK family deacetylase [Bifidobacteriaceae bacterium]|jgi:predicted glycoside hydrolase/deacetylase ChbG (UPF0249 family)|nr:ChbG/HpnK family deacetylase [Bifidobacteriaceae bacterium]